MGKASQGILGSFSGKVGNVVGRIRQGQNIYSVYQPNVANPQTVPQVKARNKFGVIADFCSSMLASVRIGFAMLDGYKRGSGFSAAVGYNSKITGIVSYSGTTATLDVSKCVIAEGIVPPAFSIAASIDGSNIVISWTDNSGVGTALANDQLFVGLYNASKRMGVGMAADKSRSDRSASIVVPEPWSGDTIDVWAFFKRNDSADCSTSVYLGNFNL